MRDIIRIHGLKTAVRVGVPEEERAHWQTVEIDVSLTPSAGFAGAGDAIERTVDYGRVAMTVREVAARRTRRLIETLAEDVAAELLESFPLDEVGITVRKFILPGAEGVSVSVVRIR